jgi:hypothetical protein
MPGWTPLGAFPGGVTLFLGDDWQMFVELELHGGAKGKSNSSLASSAA